MRLCYGAFHAALNTLYLDGDSLQLAADPNAPSLDPAVFKALADLIYKAGGFDVNQIKDPAARKMILETAAAINQGVNSALPVEVPDTLRYALEENGFIFSGFKTFHAMREVGLSLVTDDGGIKPYADFQADVLKLHDKYNVNYLYAEYKHAIASSQMAVKWHEAEADGDRYLLQYRTAEDDRVREDHAALNGITLPPSDPFWAKYYPPNGWGCRCTAVQVRRERYTPSDPDRAMLLGDNATEAAKQQIFRYNPGKSLQLFPPKHPYYKAPPAAKQVVTDTAAMPKETLIARKQLYEQLKDNDNYRDVDFNQLTGALKAVHRLHNFDKVTGEYETNTLEAAFDAGHAVVLEAERGDIRNVRHTEGTWNGLHFEIAGCETCTANNLLRGLKHCASKRTTEVAVLYFAKGHDFNPATFKQALARYCGLEKLGDGQFVKFKKIICIKDKQIVYETDF